MQEVEEADPADLWSVFIVLRSMPRSLRFAGEGVAIWAFLLRRSTMDSVTIGRCQGASREAQSLVRGE
jgi:hypothetical protein